MKVKENVSKKTLIFLVLAGIILTPIFAKIISDRIEEKLEFQPIDYETHGEDVAWDYWLKRDYDRYQSIRDGWSEASDEYSRDLSGISVKNIGQARDALHSQKNNTEYPAKMIVGRNIPSGISYTHNDVKPGGVKLSSIKNVLVKGAVDGITVDDGRVLISTTQSQNNFSENIYPDDFLIIMKSVFESDDGGPWLTIDPPQEQALQRQYGEVKYSAHIKNTHVGAVLFEADRLMKIFGLGYDNRTGEKLSMPAWHKTEFDFTDFNSPQQQTEWNRFWFTTDETVVEIDVNNRTIHITGRPFTIKTERIEMVNGVLQTSLIQDLNSAAGRWCNFFNQNIEEYYNQFPVFIELERIARITSVLQGLKACGVYFQDISLPDSSKHGISTSIKTASISVSRTRTVTDQSGNLNSTAQFSINLAGGVGMQRVKIVHRDLSVYKGKILSDYNAGKNSVERIF
jgi:hypothetical protein